MKNILKTITFLCLTIFFPKAVGQETTVSVYMGAIFTCKGEKNKEINKKYPIQSKAQLDTLKYLKQLEANKTYYICQPFSKLFNDMKFSKPLKMWVKPMHAKRKSVDVTIFCFNRRCPFNPDNAGCLSITWEEPLSYRDDYYSLEKKNNHYFTKDEETFLNSRIVKDIQVYRR